MVWTNPEPDEVTITVSICLRSDASAPGAFIAVVAAVWRPVWPVAGRPPLKLGRRYGGKRASIRVVASAKYPIPLFVSMKWGSLPLVMARTNFVPWSVLMKTFFV